MAIGNTFTSQEAYLLQLRLLFQLEEGGNQSPIPSRTLSERDRVNIQMFIRTVQSCLSIDDADSKVALKTICEQIDDCPNVLENVQPFLPLISEYLLTNDRSEVARESLIKLTDRALEVLTPLQ